MRPEIRIAAHMAGDGLDRRARTTWRLSGTAAIHGEYGAGRVNNTAAPVSSHFFEARTIISGEPRCGANAVPVPTSLEPR